MRRLLNLENGAFAEFVGASFDDDIAFGKRTLHLH
jgi:hypothetical protein